MQTKFSRIYPFLFISVFFLALLIQLGVPNLTLETVSEEFLWKDSLIRSLNNVRRRLGDRVFSEAIIGKEGWMFYTGEKSIEDYQKTLKINPKETRESLRELVLLDDAAKNYGGKLFLVVVPDKHTVYPQYMPDELSVVGELSRFDRVLNHVQEMGLVLEIVDLRGVLINASTRRQIYQKADTHWNCLGAYYAYREIMNRIARIHPEVTPHPLSDYEIVPTNPVVRDIPRMLGFDHLEGGWNLIPKFAPNRLTITEEVLEKKQYVRRIVENERSDLPTALIFYDSFYNVCFDQFVEQHFSRTYAIHYGMVEDYSDLIEKEQADVVIIQTAERFLTRVLDLIKRRG